jgi:hypothetical protein
MNGRGLDLLSGRLEEGMVLAVAFYSSWFFLSCEVEKFGGL